MLKSCSSCSLIKYFTHILREGESVKYRYFACLIRLELKIDRMLSYNPGRQRSGLFLSLAGKIQLRNHASPVGIQPHVHFQRLMLIQHNGNGAVWIAAKLQISEAYGRAGGNPHDGSGNIGALFIAWLDIGTLPAPVNMAGIPGRNPLGCVQTVDVRALRRHLHGAGRYRLAIQILDIPDIQSAVSA